MQVPLRASFFFSSKDLGGAYYIIALVFFGFLAHKKLQGSLIFCLFIFSFLVFSTVHLVVNMASRCLADSQLHIRTGATVSTYIYLQWPLLALNN